MKCDRAKGAGLEFFVSALVCICVLLAARLHGWNHSEAAQLKGLQTCSEGWYVTGYYVPREDELSGNAEQIEVERVGSLSFSDRFLTETRTEGWGITRFGWALGYYSGGWHRSDAGPLDAAGHPLSDGAIAIDRTLIPPGADVQMATLPLPWSTKVFRATEVGVGITGQHIDVFTGTGLVAEEETFRITSNNNHVCFATRAAAKPSP